MLSNIRTNDIKRLSNIFRDITKEIYPQIEFRLQSQDRSMDDLKIYLSLEYMVKAYNKLRDINCLLDKNRIYCAYANLRSLIELQVFFLFFLKYPDSILAYNRHYIFDHIKEIEESIKITNLDDPSLEKLNNELIQSQREMDSYVKDFGNIFNSPLGWAKASLKKSKNVNIPHLMKVLKLPKQYIFFYNSLHKYVHLGNYDPHQDSISYLINYTEINKKDLNTTIYKTIEFGCMLLTSTSTMLTTSLLNIRLNNASSTISKYLEKSRSINSTISEMIQKISDASNKAIVNEFK